LRWTQYKVAQSSPMAAFALHCTSSPLPVSWLSIQYITRTPSLRASPSIYGPIICPRGFAVLAHAGCRGYGEKAGPRRLHVETQKWWNFEHPHQLSVPSQELDCLSFSPKNSSLAVMIFPSSITHRYMVTNFLNLL